MKSFYITTPIYYVNDKPHIGHSYTMLAADILARYYRLKIGAANVWFLTGTDEHGIKIQQAADKRGLLPQQLADEVSAEFRLAWQNLNISNNDFIRTTEKRHEDNVSEFLTKLIITNGPSGRPVIFKGTYSGLYCYGCEAYKTAEDIENNQCVLHPNDKLAQLEEDNWFFRLSDFGEVLKSQIANGEINIQPAARHNEVLGLLNQGLEDIAISRANVAWGIPLPFDHEQTAYVWVEALLNYISALGYKDNSAEFQKFWPANVQLMAKDILKFHAVIWPALLMAAGLPLPQVIFAHGFFTVDGQKMSKSIGNVIDPNTLVEKYSSDGARYLIISQTQFGHDGDVKADEFAAKYNADLANGIGNLVSRVLGMVEKYFANQAPAAKFNAAYDLTKWWARIEANYSELKLSDNIAEIWDLIKWCDGYIAASKPWELAKTDQDKLAQVLYNVLEIIRHLALALLPYLPETAEAIFGKLSLTDYQKIKFEKLKQIGVIKPGQPVNKGEPLFMRIQ